MLRICQHASDVTITTARASLQRSRDAQASAAQPSSIQQLQEPLSARRPEPKASNGLSPHEQLLHEERLIVSDRADAGSANDSMEDSDDPAGLCVVCLETKSQVVFAPSQHAKACKTCAVKISAKFNECHVCRCTILATYTV